MCDQEGASNSLQVRSTSNNAEARHTSEEVLQVDIQRLPAQLRLSSEATQEVLQRQMAEVQAREEELRQREAAHGEALEEVLRCVPGLASWYLARVRRAAVQILVRICGKQDHQVTPSELFAQLVEAHDSGLQRVAQSLGMELEQLGEEAKAVLAHDDEQQVQLLDMERLDFDVYTVCTVQHHAHDGAAVSARVPICVRKQGHQTGCARAFLVR